MRLLPASWLCLALLGLCAGAASARPRGAGGAGGGAGAWIDQARQALQAAADPALPGAAHPGFTAAAGRLWAALDRMGEGLAARDPRFFVALRDGSRALVELRTVARRPAIGGAGGADGGAAGLDPETAARLASLTGVFRQLRRSYGAEEIRHRAGEPLRTAEARQLARLAATAREWRARVLEAEIASGPAALDPARLGELRQLAALLDRIAAAPATLAGYLNALTRSDVALGTWSGMLAFVARNEPAAGAPDPAAGSGGSEGNGANGADGATGESGAANAGSEGNAGVDASGMNSGGGSLAALASEGEVLASDAGADFVFATELDTGRTWSYLKQGGAAGGAAGAAGGWTGGSDLDPFDEYDEDGPPLDPVSLATPPPGGQAADTWEAPADAEEPSAATGSPLAAPSGEELARRLGGRFAGGRIVIHGTGSGELPDAGGNTGLNVIGWAPPDPWAEPDPLLGWLEGAPLLCSPLPPRCAARE